MSEDARHYVFPPLSRRGLVVGLEGRQLAVLGAGVVAAVGLFTADPGSGGSGAAVLLLAFSLAAACLPVAGRPPVAWLGILLSWGSRRRRGRLLETAPLDGRRPPARPRAGPAPEGLALTAAPERPGSFPMGVLVDRRAGTLAAVLPVRGRSFSLLDTEEKERRLAGWGALLAGAARLGTPVYRLQWVERTSPGESDGLQRYLEEAGAPGPASSAARRSYAALIAGAGPATQDHETFLVVAVRPRRGLASGLAARRGGQALQEVLRREVRLLSGALRSTDLVGDRPLGPDELALAIRAGSDRRARHWPAGLAAGWPWPMASDEAWSALRVDGSWHASFWVAEWPRVEVGPDFLTPLLLSGGERVVSLTLGPVPPDRASREAESARTAGLADDELRRRAGFLTTARHQREAEGVLRREAELADGHADFRFSGYVTVSAADRSELEASCAAVEQAAQAAHLVLRRLYGQQARAYTWTLPIGRGLL